MMLTVTRAKRFTALTTKWGCGKMHGAVRRQVKTTSVMAGKNWPAAPAIGHTGLLILQLDILVCYSCNRTDWSATPVIGQTGLLLPQ